MQLSADVTGFIVNATVTITDINSEVITVATATTDANGDFSATFTVPPSVAGDHTVIASHRLRISTCLYTTSYL